MNVLVTGAKGFIGSNLCEWLRSDVTLLTFELGDTDQELREHLAVADFVYHLAGVMRPDNEEEFEAVNVGLTERICEHLQGRKVPIVFTSSVQAKYGNPYGKSKRRAENVLDEYADGAPVLVYRLTNVFGKWARPNYTSVVATFCHNIARDLEIEISDPDRELALVYIDDVARSFLEDLGASGSGMRYRHVEPHHHVTLGDLAGLIRSFRATRDGLQMPDLRGFSGKLYGTYVSYLEGFSYALDQRTDDRGSLAEFIKADSFGQIFVSRTKPGVTRGGHFHRTKAEKFLVLEGRAVVRLRHDDRVVAMKVSGTDMRSIDIAPGYVHSIENVGTGDLITLFWASEVFDPENPDTYREPNVLRS